MSELVVENAEKHSEIFLKIIVNSFKNSTVLLNFNGCGRPLVPYF
jgi:hypothetical protein